jgi:hypothetical protein
MEIGQQRRLRWLRLLARAVYIVVGALQCLLGVMFAVYLIFSVVTDFGEGPSSVAESLVALAVVVVLFGVGLLTLVSAMEEWEPPRDRWQGIRWLHVGLGGSLISLASWGAVLALGWLR